MPGSSKRPRDTNRDREHSPPTQAEEDEVLNAGGQQVGHIPRAVAANLAELLDGHLIKVEGRMDALTADEDASKLPLHPSPPGLENGQLLVDILPHQSQALKWMIDRENPALPRTESDLPVQFWIRKPDYYLNVVTNTPQTQAPTLGRGGIIADDMGLGKTLTTLSLILATKSSTDSGFSATTLIVCPLSVLSNWEKQLADHVAPSQLSFHTYHGASRGIILTTYQTIQGEGSEDTGVKKVKTTRGPLFKVKWKRLVADEGHQLKNPKAKMTRAFTELTASRRWICTVGKLLQALVGQVLLRRTKDSKDANGNDLVSLPPIEFFRCAVQLDDETRKLYDEVQESTKRRFQEAMQTGEVGNVLSMLTRSELNFRNPLTSVRQLCLSSELVPKSFLDELRNPPTITLAPEDHPTLVAKLRQYVADDTECGVCYDEVEFAKQPCITECGHPCALCPVRWKDERKAGESLEGSLCSPQRQHVITAFQTARAPKVMLISLKSGAVGLNLTAASNVFLSAIEAQAIDRVHRAFEKTSKETTRAKKEARFEELKELLGLK
ncbi:hypothetical protein IAR55_001787 [Kwoniella newhampshirensis]|uniref:Helicase ATP-binding domain-containing protein n=1 Tax=Kwoniella newhampshirensis TaxID=1651941 RepID=A0AAW0Z347_9TREE